ncbi:hypothetical protein EP56_01580 [Listeriaceae bacterium FSL A5-0209]|nr:hypothetical protein EP56_01580 [Listeriaceae bacterium FSL A5-0209]
MYNENYWRAIDLVTHNGITVHKKRNSTFSLRYLQLASGEDASSTNRKGVHFVVARKADLYTNYGVKGYIATSKETLISDAQTLTHWTPNTYRYGEYANNDRTHIKGHREDNLQQINTFVVDIDSQQTDVPGIVVAAAQYSVGAPTFILKTAKGFQAYFVLDSPAFISNNQNFKGLRVAKVIAANIKHSLSRFLPAVDLGCNDFGFFRMPRPDNLVYFDEESVFSFADLRDWSTVYSEKHKTRGIYVASSVEPGAQMLATDRKWFDQLIHLTNIRGGRGSYGRNTAVFTLALACYSSGKSLQEATDLLDEFNTNLRAPISFRELERSLESAYSGKYKGAKLEFIEGLLETYDMNQDYKNEMSDPTAFIFQTTGYRRFRKHKKPREQRQFSHINEWESDMLEYIEKHLVSGQTFLFGSQRELAEKMAVPYSSFKKVIQQSKQIVKKTTGRGRHAVSYVSTIAIIVRESIRHAIQKKNEAAQDYAAYLASFSDVAERIITIIAGKQAKEEPTIRLFERLSDKARSHAQLSFKLLESLQRRAIPRDLQVRLLL